MFHYRDTIWNCCISRTLSLSTLLGNVVFCTLSKARKKFENIIIWISLEPPGLFESCFFYGPALSTTESSLLQNRFVACITFSIWDVTQRFKRLPPLRNKVGRHTLFRTYTTVLFLNSISKHIITAIQWKHLACVWYGNVFTIRHGVTLWTALRRSRSSKLSLLCIRIIAVFLNVFTYLCVFSKWNLCSYTRKHFFNFPHFSYWIFYTKIFCLTCDFYSSHMRLPYPNNRTQKRRSPIFFYRMQDTSRPLGFQCYISPILINPCSSTNYDIVY